MRAVLRGSDAAHETMREWAECCAGTNIACSVWVHVNRIVNVSQYMSVSIWGSEIRHNPLQPAQVRWFEPRIFGGAGLTACNGLTAGMGCGRIDESEPFLGEGRRQGLGHRHVSCLRLCDCSLGVQIGIRDENHSSRLLVRCGSDGSIRFANVCGRAGGQRTNASASRSRPTHRSASRNLRSSQQPGAAQT